MPTMSGIDTSGIDTTAYRLTQFAHGGGCACKIPPGELEQILSGLVTVTSPDLLVGLEHGDDAAVVRVRDGLAVVSTADFFTPVVDDAYDWGRIAAANAFSDVYAMGARPLTALNIVSFPSGVLPLEYLGRILLGGAEIARQASATIVGGHTIDDEEPKFGLSVMGVVDPDRVVRNIGVCPGDVFILTKAIGTGVIGTALKRGLESEDSVREVVESMATLNRDACEAMQEVGVHAATDVTGFGIAGHLHEMLEGSGCAGEIEFGTLPLFDDVLDYAADGVVPGRTAEVIEFAAAFTDWTGRPAPTVPGSPIDDLARWRVLCDPQTSGGLLIAVAPDRADVLASALATRGVLAALVGGFVEGEAGRLSVS